MSITVTTEVLFHDDMQSLDLAGPLDVFGNANQHAGQAQQAYALHTIGLSRRPVRAEADYTSFVRPEYELGCDIGERRSREFWQRRFGVTPD